MELKFEMLNVNTLERILLLIVPYGIEISSISFNVLLNRLLIVPYGIEIMQNDLAAQLIDLLIVPYGIEIFLACYSD